MDKIAQAQIDSHWEEEAYYFADDSFKKSANMADASIFKKFDIKNYPDCFSEYAQMLDWYKPYKQVLDTSNAPFWKWFGGGQLNACYNCVDRHLDKQSKKIAYTFVPEPEDEPPINYTYKDLYGRVNSLAYVLQKQGLKRGDCVTLHMPMAIELPITMLACARLGVIHSQVFAGFSGKACAERIKDSKSKMLITMDSYYRNGKKIDHKLNADIAVKEAKKLGQPLQKLLIWQRYPGKYGSSSALQKNRDFILNDLVKKAKNKLVEPQKMDSASPLFLMYTSGTTGKPKGIQHGTGGYLAYVTATTKWILDIKPKDVYWCMADIGWITGHSYIVYGPLSIGATSIIYEGSPTYPDAGRAWRIAQKYKVNIFHTSPTAIRTLRKLGNKEPLKYKFKFKSMTTVGEPIEPETWRWYFNNVGKKKAVITDTWWQSETGGFLCSTVPALNPMKPGSAGPGLPGIYPVILDETGKEIPPNLSHAGNLCIKNPWPGIMQTIWGDPDRYVKTYYSKYNKKPGSKRWQDWIYESGDGALITKDGYVRILGRIDDVINVSGHRLGTKEIESACLELPVVAESAVVAQKDEIKGHVPIAFVSLNKTTKNNQEVKKSIIKNIEHLVGKIARPKEVYIVADMPKTRSGKIMRRVLASLVNNSEVGDVSTLDNPDSVDEISKIIKL